MRLIDLQIGEKAKIKELKLDREMMRRLWDLGFTKGTEIKPVQSSPSGDPIAYKVRGTIFAVRKKDAEKIDVWEENTSAVDE